MTDSNTPAPQKSGIQVLMDKVVAVEKKWWTVLLPALSFIIVIAVLGLKLALARRQVVSLQIQLDNAKEAAKEAVEDAQMAKNDADRQAALAEVAKINAQIAQLEQAMAARNQDHQDYVTQLQGVTSWDQINVTGPKGA